MGLYDLITNRPLTLPSASLSKKVLASTVCARTSGGAILSCAITPIVKVDTNISRTNKADKFPATILCFEFSDALEYSVHFDFGCRHRYSPSSLFSWETSVDNR